MANELIGNEEWQNTKKEAEIELAHNDSGEILYTFSNDLPGTSISVTEDGYIKINTAPNKVVIFSDNKITQYNLPISGVQVYQATHDGEGYYLPYMRRAFISFSYGGKNIEDFSLISTISGDSLNRQLTPNFEDNTSTYEVIDGQFYWGTHFTNNSIAFELSTDGMTELDLDNFLNWFQPGQIKELILAEHPNRAIMARVATPPQLNMLPFEEKTTVIIAGEEYETSTTKYKGNIILEMVMDDPFWYAKANLLDKCNEQEKLWQEFWVDSNGEIKTDLLQEKDALKIIKEDLIPLRRMLQETVLLGDDSIVGVLPGGVMLLATSKAAPIDWTQEQQDLAIRLGDYNNIYAVTNLSLIDEEMKANQSYNIYFPTGKELFLYYCGTAPSYPTIGFSLYPTFDNNNYISSPASKFNPKQIKVNDSLVEVPYSTIYLESTKINEFNFTLPSLFYAYNKIIEFLSNLIKNTTEDKAWITIREYIRENIKHPEIRKRVNKLIDNLATDDVFKVNEIKSIINELKSQVSKISVKLNFNLKTGEFIGIYTDAQQNKSWIEDVGDMICSNHFVIEERNYPTANGYIIPWGKSHPTTSHRIWHNCNCPLENFTITYKNLYY